MWTLLTVLLIGVAGTESLVLPKCCPEGEAAYNTGCGPANSAFMLPPEFWDQNQTQEFTTRHSKPSCERTIPVVVIHILKNGYISAPSMNVDLISPTNYCLDNYNNGTRQVEMAAFICQQSGADNLTAEVENSPPQVKILFAIPTGSIISCACLIIITLIYTFNERFHNAHGKIVKFYSLTLAAAYLFTAVEHLYGSSQNKSFCDFFGLIINFCYLSSSFWMFFMCYNTRKDIIEIRGGKREGGQRLSLLMLGTVCAPLLVITATSLWFITAHFNLPSDYVKSNYHGDACWVKPGIGAAVPFEPVYGLALILLIADISFIVSSWVHLEANRITKSILPLLHNWNGPKYRKTLQLRQCLFLSVLQVGCWVVDVASVQLGADWVEDCMLAEGLAALQGVVLVLPLVVLDPQLRADLRYRSRVSFHSHPQPVLLPQPYPNFVFGREHAKVDTGRVDFCRQWSVA